MSFPAPRRLPILLGITAAVIVLDRLTKHLVSTRIPLGGAVPLIPRVLRISHWTNEGAAFSIFADSASPHAVRWALAGFAIFIALVVFGALVRFGSRISRATIALALILGGALGNVYDRIAYGSVVDFIEVHIFGYHWPDFNVADSAIVIGACLLMLDSLLTPRASSTAPTREA